MVQRISREEVAHVARLAQLALSEDELDAFTSQLAAVLDHAADLEALNVDDVEPSTHPFPLKNVLRIDEPGEVFAIEEVIEVAPEVEEGQFRVPRILGES
ncbi:MAG: Asp-tRNA(Asn)/Glu-tRNA(Gln) amidotransferase subunit GatC [Acidimicrobiales bacterium]|nr:Asp-tRNA(Asn)/Glu-tRNA(Gln) amidotransferase subunit GatC [Acidimicrobiales bacterium]MDP6894570.1 Asp-tRNA(Asn)/Glu-tRNA(Gln) amidotransferase subunit GatC [Acidimicrobiales bacterium]HJM38075.1 Asp-tRNA(Asn)/Glu-tRNA(Gln) amidotransferase subunit GatC [Acidimicrobiales bacterium]